MNPVKASLRYPIVSLILAAMAVAVGLCLRHMPRTEDPTVTIRTGLVIALLSGATLAGRKAGGQDAEKHIFKFPKSARRKPYSTSRPVWSSLTWNLKTT
jgi:hypothetical protein